VSAVKAAVTAATSLGVTCDDPVVLQDGSNIVVHLRPAPVIARVATVTAECRPGVAAWFARDVAVATHLAARGVLATRPFGEPVDVAGTVVQLWHHERHDPDHVVSPEAIAARLADLHRGLADLDADLPRFGPFEDLARNLAALADTVPAAALTAMFEESERLRAVVAEFPVRPLHGDAHPGNLLATPSGLMWNDFEDAWLGPLGWDLACLARSKLVDGAAAVAAYPGEFSQEELAACVQLRELSGVAWRFMLARRFPHRRAAADEALHRWLLSRGSPG
jgi:aminoglycoside phosphotransferase (APT) family kinase protein